MQRSNSSTSSLMETFLDSSNSGTSDIHDLDSSCGDPDVFDPPAWRPGRYLQFADILTVEDEPTVRPVSLPCTTGRLAPLHGRCSGSGGVGEETKFQCVQFGGSRSDSSIVQMESGGPVMSVLHCRSSVSRRTTLLVTACMAVALTALTLLSFVLY